MAKFTARFDLEDRISKKLGKMTRNLDRIDQLAKKLGLVEMRGKDGVTPVADKIDKTMRKRHKKPHTMTIGAEDRTEKTIKRLKKRLANRDLKQHKTLLFADAKRFDRTMKTVKRKLTRTPKKVDITFSAQDKLTPRMKRIENNIRRRLGREQEYSIRAKDETTRVISRINSFAKRTLSRGYTATINTIDRFTSQVNRMAAHGRSLFSKTYSMTVGLIDRASGPSKKIYNYANNHLNRTFTLTVKVADLATRPLRKIGSLASSTGAMLGFGAGAYGGVVAPLKAQADRQNMTTAFETLLGSREAADARLDELVSFAGQTPFTRDEIFEASRVLQIFTDGALASADAMKLVGDVAAGTQKPFADVSLWIGRLYDGLESGRPIGDATAALQEMGAISGKSRARLEKLAESGKDISEIWPDVTQEFERFDDMMIKMSDNLANLTLGVKSFINNSIIMPWGKGLASVVQPALSAFREWRSEHSYVIAEMTKQMEVAGENFAKAIMNPMNNTFGFIGDQLKILFPGEMTAELEEKFKEDPAARKRFEELEQYRDMTFKARWDIVWENTQDVFGEWWAKTGEPGLLKGAEKVGEGYGSFLGGIVRGIFNIEDETDGNSFVEAGTKAGRTFVSAFIEAFDPVDIAKRLGKKWLQVNWDFFTGNGDLNSFILTNLVAGAALGRLMKFLKPIKDVISGIFRTIEKIGKVKFPKIPPMGGIPGSGAKNKGPTRPPNGSTTKAPNRPSIPPIFTGNGKLPKIPDWMKKAGKRVPFLGTALAGGAILTEGGDRLGANIGGLAGGVLGGAAAGAAAGSIVPGVGTVVGGLAGAVGGAIGGEKLGDWVQHSGILDSINNTLFNKEWWSNKWNEVKGVTSNAWDNATSIWSVVKEGASITLFNGEWWSQKWKDVTAKASELYEGSWMDKALSTIGDTIFSGDWWGQQWDSVVSLASNLTSISWWQDLAGELFGYLETTIFNGEWWGAKWDEVVFLAKSLYEGSWMDNAITAIGDTVFNGEWWGQQWDKTVEGAKKLYEGSWLDKAVTTIGDTIFSGEWWGQKWNDVMTWSMEKAVFFGGVGMKVIDTLKETIFSGEWWSNRWDDVKAWAQSSWDSAQAIWDSVKTKLGETIFNGDWWGQKWNDVKAWSQSSWDSAQEIWNSVKTRLGDTIFNSEWWGQKWENVKKWSSDKWETAKSVWRTVRTSINETLFSKDWWSDKWGKVLDWGQGILGGIGDWFNDNFIEPFNEGRKRGQKKGKEEIAKSRARVNNSSSKVAMPAGGATPYANGAIINRPHLGLVGEAGPEAIIPLSASRRSRALALYEQTGRELGVRPYANGGIVGGGASIASQPAAVSAVVAVDRVKATGLAKEGLFYGQQFSESVESGVNGNVISLDAWKQRNISTPMQSVVKDAVGFGTGTVQSFSRGQNTSATGTQAYLQQQVKRPFQVIQGGAAAHGSGTVQGFRSGQNASQTGTQSYLNAQVKQPFEVIKSAAPAHGTGTIRGFRSGQDRSQTGTKAYLQRQVHMPFNQTRARGSGWGSELIGEFVTGMRSKEAQVTEAAKILSDAVEKTFRERLGIHSPSRVMMELGRFASLGIVKGLDSVDLEKFADKQVTGLIGVYAGQAPNFGSAFTMTSGFGSRRSPGGIGSTNHKGLDFAAPMGTPIPAQAPGVVSFAGWQGGYGNLVRIQGADGLEYLYGHNSKNLVKKGDLVSRGQTIGLVGSTGNSTGPHVHYEVRRNGQAINPLAMPGGGAAGNIRSWIAQAVLATGVDKSWIDPLTQIAMKESGGNPRAVNNWDINAKRGTPSKGLMQTIDPTFNAYKVKGMDDIYNPVHNAAAAIRYIQSRYGSVWNTPGMRAMAKGGGYRGYANGGLINHEQIARIGEAGRREWIIPVERGIRGRYLLQRAANDLGMDVVEQGSSNALDADTVRVATGATNQKTVVTQSDGGMEVHIHFHGDQIFSNTQDRDELLTQMERRLEKVLKEARMVGTSEVDAVG